MQKEGLDRIVLEKLNMDYSPANMEGWEKMVYKINHPQKKVKIAVVGKYVELPDAYISVTEALHHGGIASDAQVKIHWVNAEQIEDPETDLDEVFVGCKGILVPGGFGNRGVEGKIKAIQYAREHKIPFLGLCLGMQCAVIEFARHVCGMTDAQLRDQSGDEASGHRPHGVPAGCREQGRHDAPGSLSLQAHERHAYEEAYGASWKSTSVIAIASSSTTNTARLTEAKGLVIAGTLPDDSLVEIVELK